jgi:hypothetical protein
MGLCLTMAPCTDDQEWPLELDTKTCIARAQEMEKVNFCYLQDFEAGRLPGTFINHSSTFSVPENKV